VSGRHRPVRIDTYPVVELSAAVVIVVGIALGALGTIVPDAEAGQVAPTSCEVVGQ